MLSHGPANVSLIDNDTRPRSLSTDNTLTLTVSPIVKTSPGLAICS